MEDIQNLRLNSPTIYALKDKRQATQMLKDELN